MEDLFKTDAKDIIDSLFDAKLFRDDLTRDDISAAEEFLLFCMNSRYEQKRRVERLLGRVEYLPK